MHLNPAIPLQALDIEILTRLGVAAALGLLVGLDRELRGWTRTESAREPHRRHAVFSL